MADYNDSIKMFSAIVHDLDLDSALRYCGGSMEFYAEMLGDYADSGNKAKIEDLYAKRDMDAYTLEVHALKSTSRTLGLTAIGDLAEKMQHAAENKDMEYVDGNHGKLMRELGIVINTIKSCFR